MVYKSPIVKFEIGDSGMRIQHVCLIEKCVSLITAEYNNLSRVQRPMIRCQEVPTTSRGPIENLRRKKNEISEIILHLDVCMLTADADGCSHTLREVLNSMIFNEPAPSSSGYASSLELTLMSVSPSHVLVSG